MQFKATNEQASYTIKLDSKTSRRAGNVPHIKQRKHKQTHLGSKAIKWERSNFVRQCHHHHIQAGIHGNYLSTYAIVTYEAFLSSGARADADWTLLFFRGRISST